MMLFSRCETDFNLDKYLVRFLTDTPFFAELSRHVRKTPTLDMPTCGIVFNPKLDELILFWNPVFFKTLTNWQIQNVLTHEFYHIVFGHLQARRKTPANVWNIATDLAINSIIVKAALSHRPKDVTPDEEPMPEGVLIPGIFPTVKSRQMTPEEKKASKIGTLIESFPTCLASEQYFGELMKVVKSGDDDDLEGLIPIDDHSYWDEIPDAQREYIEGRIKSIVEKAVKFADSKSNGWGTVPHDIVSEIRASVSSIVNWRAVLRQFVGSMVHGTKSSTLKKINKRYPYIHPGTKRRHQARLLIALDESGSVGNEMLEMFFGELKTLSKNVEFDVLPFDWTAHEEHIFTWHRGGTPQIKRIKSGGTSFDAPVKVYNDPKNRKRWDGLMICTDGGADKPTPIMRGRRAWVLGKGTKLGFDTDELQIFLDNDKPMTGAWR